MYLSKKGLIQKENIDPAKAEGIWSKFYFTGWNHFLPIGTTIAIVFIVFFFKLQTWLIFAGILLVHSFVALPITSQNIRNIWQMQARMYKHMPSRALKGTKTWRACGMIAPYFGPLAKC